MTKSAENKHKTRTDEGGYYAIKGFLYQFDKTLIEVITNPQTRIGFENRQDIDYEDYVLQVKHKETQDYTPSKIRKPVEKLLDSFSGDSTKKFCLYCYFRDRKPQDWHLTLSELDSIISTNTKKLYSESIRKQFIEDLAIKFSEDYETQFRQTLDLIKSAFSLRNREEAILYHSIFRSKLFDRSLLPKKERHVCLSDLKHFLEDTEVTVFHAAYAKYIGADKYAKLIKKKYFTFSAPNIDNFERLFLIECGLATNQVDLLQIANRIAHKFYRKGKSPQPYIVFHNLTDDSLKQLKQDLFDSEISFFDGTHFDGDRFRLDEFAENCINNGAFMLKILPESETTAILQKVKVKVIFQFFINHPVSLKVSGKHCRIQVDNAEHVLQMIN